MAPQAHLTVRVRQVVAMALIGGALYAGWTHRQELRRAFDALDHPIWGWLVAACLVQASSMVVFARLQRWLLRCGGVRVRLRDMVEITLAGNALSTSLPGGAAWAAGWVWGQLRRRSVERVLAGWVVLVAGALSSFALFALVVVGAELAGPTGPVASLRWVDRALLLVALLMGAGLVALARSARLQRRWRARVERAERHRGRVDAAVRRADRFGHEVRLVTPTPIAWVEAFLLALANWGADLATLVFCSWAVHAPIPWHGIVVAYALTQISASVPVTPGGLAVVEASLGALLVGYGMPYTAAVTVVLLYRLISFWCLVPIGWAAWGLLEVTQRRSTTRHHPWAVHRHGPRLPAGASGVVPSNGARPEASPPHAWAGIGSQARGAVARQGEPARWSAAAARVGLPEPSAPAGSAQLLTPGLRRGPERLLGTSDCDGCDETEELSEPARSRLQRLSQLEYDLRTTASNS